MAFTYSTVHQEQQETLPHEEEDQHDCEQALPPTLRNKTTNLPIANVQQEEDSSTKLSRLHIDHDDDVIDIKSIKDRQGMKSSSSSSLSSSPNGASKIAMSPSLTVLEMVRQVACWGSSTTSSGWCSSLLVFLFGQGISLLATTAGATQSTLELDCHLNAPTLSLTPFFFLLSLGVIPLYFLHKQNQQQQEQEHSQDSTVGNASSPEALHKEPQDIKADKIEEGNESSPRSQHSLQEVEPQDSCTDMEKTKKESALPINSDTDTTPSTPTSTTATTHTFFGLIPLSRSMLVYFGVALADFYANYFTVLAYRYTSITSVALSDALALPTAMILSRVWFQRRYSLWHYIGVLICLSGILLNFYQDYQTDHANSSPSSSFDPPMQPTTAMGTEDVHLLAEQQHEGELDAAYPHKAVGDLLGLLGGILFGVSNTIAEFLVCDPNHPSETIANVEYLSMVGFFSIIVCVIQVALFETDQVQDFLFALFESDDDLVHDDEDDECSAGKVFGLWMGFSFCWFLFYVCSARFLQVSEAVYYNLSLTTDDFWCTGFSLIAQHIAPMPLFYPSLALILGGTVLYEMLPTPEDEQEWTAVPQQESKPEDGVAATTMEDDQREPRYLEVEEDETEVEEEDEVSLTDLMNQREQYTHKLRKGNKSDCDDEEDLDPTEEESFTSFGESLEEPSLHEDWFVRIDSRNQGA